MIKAIHTICEKCKHAVYFEAPRNGLLLSCDFIVLRVPEGNIANFLLADFPNWSVFFYKGYESDWSWYRNESDNPWISNSHVPEKCPFILEHAIE